MIRFALVAAAVAAIVSVILRAVKPDVDRYRKIREM